MGLQPLVLELSTGPIRDCDGMTMEPLVIGAADSPGLLQSCSMVYVAISVLMFDLLCMTRYIEDEAPCVQCACVRCIDMT